MKMYLSAILPQDEIRSIVLTDFNNEKKDPRKFQKSGQ